jgi:predicted RNase H-like HicB family nuclease
MTMQIVPIKTPQIQRVRIVREDLATDGSVIYVAEVPELPGCMAHGETPEEAMQNLWEAEELYLEALRDSGQIPEARRNVPFTAGTGMHGPEGHFRANSRNVESELTVELKK